MGWVWVRVFGGAWGVTRAPSGCACPWRQRDVAAAGCAGGRGARLERDAVLRDEDVAELQVAVDDALGVEVEEAREDLADEGGDDGLREAAALLAHVGEGARGALLHEDVDVLVVLEAAAEGDDVAAALPGAWGTGGSGEPGRRAREGADGRGEGGYPQREWAGGQRGGPRTGGRGSAGCGSRRGAWRGRAPSRAIASPPPGGGGPGARALEPTTRGRRGGGQPKAGEMGSRGGSHAERVPSGERRAETLKRAAARLRCEDLACRPVAQRVNDGEAAHPEVPAARRGRREFRERRDSWHRPRAE